MKYSLLSVILFFFSIGAIAQMKDDRAGDRALLSKLNGQFIKNFVAHDTLAHNEIIHKDFVCIENNGQIANRKEYMKDWVTDYPNGGFTSFTYKDEFIRFFGDVALVRSKTVYTRIKEGKTVNGRWWCIQAQITPVQ